MPNETTKIPFTLDDLYKTLKKHDSDILKHFNDTDLSDDLYLFYGINSDIISNALSIVINLLTGNPYSPGIDQNCRAILEAFVILKMMAPEAGEITGLQAKIYRYQYALVDHDNFRGKIPESDRQKEPYLSLMADAEKAYDALSEHFGIEKKELKKKKALLKDPHTYLKKNLYDNINFSHLLQTHPIFNERTMRSYEFFSLFIHPRFEKDNSFEERLLKMRDAHIDAVLNYVIQYLASSKLLVIDPSLPGFDEDFIHNPVLANNNHNIEQIRVAFKYVIDQTCFFKEGYDAYTMFFLKQMQALLVDLVISESLGYKEQILAKFKPFLENAAVYSVINCIDGMDEFKARKLAFCYSSRLQIMEHFKAIGVLEKETFLPQVQAVYELWYKDHYHVPFEQFYASMSKNSRYFLSPDDASNTYGFIVKDSISKVIAASDQELVWFLYKQSQDMSHASGYNFNSCPGISDYYCRVAMYSVWKYMVVLLENMELVLADHGVETDLRAVIDAFALFMAVENSEANNEREKLKREVEESV